MNLHKKAFSLASSMYIYIYTEYIILWLYYHIQIWVHRSWSCVGQATLTNTFSKAKFWNASGNAGHLLILQPRHVSWNAEDIVLIKLLYMQYILMLLSNATMLNWLGNSTQRIEEVLQEHFKFPSVYLLSANHNNASCNPGKLKKLTISQALAVTKLERLSAAVLESWCFDLCGAWLETKPSSHTKPASVRMFEQSSSTAGSRPSSTTKCWQATMLEDQTFQGQIVRLGLVQNRLAVNGDQNQIWNKVSTPEHLL